MTDETKNGTGAGQDPAPPKKGMSLSTQILIALAGGIATGIFFGEGADWLKGFGTAYVGLMQMTVLPYIIVALVGNIGRLSFAQGRALFAKGVLFLLLLWGIGLGVVTLTGLSFPSMETGAFFSTTLLEAPPKPDIVGLFVPFNVFDSIVKDSVPAIVVFCIFLGVALMGVPGKEKVIDVLDVIQQSLGRVNGIVAKLTPVGVFAMVAAAAGTMTISEFGRIQGYLISYTIMVLVLTFWILPSLVAALTPIHHREILRATRASLITAFATGKVLIVLPMLIEETKGLFAKLEVNQEDAAGDIEVLYPLAYSFPHLGKLMGLFFIPFAAWFLGKPLALLDYPLFLLTGLLTYFGGPVAATPFLLSLQDLPSDMMQLFLVSGIWTARLGDVLGAMHLIALTILTTSALTGVLKVNTPRLLRCLLGSAVLLLVCLGGTRLYLASTFEGTYQKDDVLAALHTLERADLVEFLDAPAPHEVPLAGKDKRLERLRESRAIRVGFDPDRRPFSFRNPRGDLVGLDVELALNFAEKTGTKVLFVPIDVDDAARHLAEDHVDIVVGGLMGILARAETTTLSRTYLNGHPAFVVKEDRADEFKVLSEVMERDDVVVGIPNETLYEGLARRFAPEKLKRLASAQSFFESPEPLADALFVTAEAGFAWTLVHPSYTVVIPEGAERAVPLALALPQGEPDFERYINRWIEMKQLDGTLDELYDHWVLGKQKMRRPPRWSVIRDVLGWID